MVTTGNASGPPPPMVVPVDREVEALATHHLRTGGGILPAAGRARFMPQLPPEPTEPTGSTEGEP